MTDTDPNRGGDDRAGEVRTASHGVLPGIDPDPPARSRCYSLAVPAAAVLDGSADSLCVNLRK